MKINMKVGHWYQLNNGEVHQCVRGEDNPLSMGGRWYSQDGGSGLIYSTDPMFVSHEVFPKPLRDLGAKGGDVVLCVKTDFPELYTVGREYTTVVSDYPVGETCITGDLCNLASGASALFIVTTPRTPSTWGEMTEAEQNEIAGHAARGCKVDELYLPGDWADKMGHGFYDHKTYRKKPEPVVETVTLHGRSYSVGWDLDRNPRQEDDTHKITFDTVDGEPDCSTVKMECLQ